MAVGDLFEVRFLTQMQNQLGVNVRHYVITEETGTGATPQEIAVGLSTVFAPLYRNLMTDQADFRGVGARKIAPGLPEGEALDNTGFGPGDVAGDALPKQVAGLISLRTNSVSGAKRGRLYIPFPSEVSNTLGSAPEAIYQVAAGALRDQIIAFQVITGGGGTATLQPVVKAGVGLLTAPIVGGTVRPAWATQRRRGDFGAINVPPI